MEKLNKLSKAIVAVVAFLCFSLNAQPWRTREAIIVSGGNFGNSGNMARVYSYKGNTLSLVDSLPGNYTNDATAYNGYAYLNIDTTLYSYDLQTFPPVRKNSAVISNLTQLDHNDRYLLALRGYATSDYLRIYDLVTLSLAFRDTALHGAKAMKVVNDTAYIVTDNNGVNGSIYEYSLGNTPAFIKKVDFSYAGGTNLIGSMVADKNYIYLLSDKYAFVQGLYIFDRKKNTAEHDSARVSNNGLWAESGVIYANFGSGLYSFDTKIKKANLIAPINYNNGAYDTLSKLFYLVKGDFSHPDTVFIYTKTGSFVTKFASGVSSQAVAFDYRNENAIAEETVMEDGRLNIYPNPASSLLYINAKEFDKGEVSIRDVTGKLVYSQEINSVSGRVSLDVSTFPQGIYLLSLQNGQQLLYSRFVKQ